jgi:hypothetical protein
VSEIDTETSQLDGKEWMGRLRRSRGIPDVESDNAARHYLRHEVMDGESGLLCLPHQPVWESIADKIIDGVLNAAAGGYLDRDILDIVCTHDAPPLDVVTSITQSAVVGNNRPTSYGARLLIDSLVEFVQANSFEDQLGSYARPDFSTTETT